MAGGSFNRIIGLEFPSGQHRNCILRIPRMQEETDILEPIELSDQICILQHLSQFDFLHVPKTLAYDTTQNNTIGSRYILQERLQGKGLCHDFYDAPLAERLEITTLIAEVLIKMESIPLDKPGRLIGSRSLPPVSHIPPESVSQIKITGFRENPRRDLPSVEKQHLTSLLTEILEIQKNANGGEEDFVESMFAKLQSIALEMEKAGLIRKTDVGIVLWHWDFSPQNVLINRTAKIAQPQNSSRPLKGCEHSVQIAVDDVSGSGNKHTIQVKLEGASSTTCKHKIQVSVDDISGRNYRHIFEISGTNQQPEKTNYATIDSSKDHPQKAPQPDAQQSNGLPNPKWFISGVIDWDDVKSVPRVFARKPPSWLWFNEDDRTGAWDGDRDAKPERDLTADELLIKAHFDQIMARADPNYIDEAYHRGVWLRGLAQFALEGFSDNRDFDRFDRFTEQWDTYLKETGLKIENGNPEGDSEEDNAHGSEDGSEEDNEEAGEDGGEEVTEEGAVGNSDEDNHEELIKLIP